VKFVGR